MRNNIKKYIVYIIVYLVISVAYLVYCYVRDGTLNLDYISVSVLSMVVYSIAYFLLCKFGESDWVIPIEW